LAALGSQICVVPPFPQVGLHTATNPPACCDRQQTFMPVQSADDAH
jgi:hypothetical protein